MLNRVQAIVLAACKVELGLAKRGISMEKQYRAPESNDIIGRYLTAPSVDVLAARARSL